MTDQYFQANWPAPAGVRTLLTTRAGGKSSAPFDSNNLATHVGDSAESVEHNRSQLSRLLGGDVEIQWLRQVHGVELIQAGVWGAPPEADGCLTREARRACAVLTADCLPILLCDRQASQVAAVHAGWRGLAQGILIEAIKKFSAPQDVLVYLGPAISQQHFEVGDEVRQSFVKSAERAALGSRYQKDVESAFTASANPGRWYADLYGLAGAQCRALGVMDVSGGKRCTFEERHQFYSYRRDGDTGRMASVIWLA